MSANPKESGMLTIWGRRNSVNVQKAMWALGEVGVPHQRIDAGGEFGGLDTPEFAALNPNRRVPVLQDGDTVVWESSAIVRYLAAKYGEGTLWDPDPGLRAKADTWMAWAQTAPYREFIDLFWGYVRTPPEQRDMDAVRAANGRMVKHLELLDRELATRPYLAGEAFTMGDIPAGALLYRYFAMELERPALPNLKAWHARLSDRPAHQAHVAIPFPEMWGRLTS
jgi:glutathione S-transferase